MRTYTVVVLSAGLGRPSSTRMLADQLADATKRSVAERGGRVEVIPVELRELAHDITDNLLTGFPSLPLRTALDAVGSADAVIAVTPVFSASYSGLFKSFFDVLDESALLDKPVLLAATGGTARHSLALEHALRPMFTHMRATVVPTSVFAAPEDWAGGSGPSGALAVRIERAARELADQMERRESRPVRDPFDLPVTFDRLLAGD